MAGHRYSNWWWRTFSDGEPFDCARLLWARRRLLLSILGVVRGLLRSASRLLHRRVYWRFRLRHVELYGRLNGCPARSWRPSNRAAAGQIENPRFRAPALARWRSGFPPAGSTRYARTPRIYTTVVKARSLGWGMGSS